MRLCRRSCVCTYAVSDYLGGKKKPLKAPKKERKDLDEVSLRGCGVLLQTRLLHAQLSRPRAG